MHGRSVHELPRFQARLDDQARRTASLRRSLYERAGIARARRVLDVGCGSGAVTSDLQAHAHAGGTVVAVDADRRMVARSRERLGPRVPVLHADGRALPFADGHFDAAVCNLVLLWSPEPAAVVREMARVVRPGGVVLCSMEPDYGGKVHHPENPLIDLVFRGDGIRRRGGDPHAGRRLRDHFVRAGLQVDVGIGNLEVLSPQEDLDLWRRQRGFYRRLLREAGFGRPAVDDWEAEYVEAIEAGIQLSWFPLFHALGRKPAPDDDARP